MAQLEIPQTLAEWNARGREWLPGHLGIEFLAVEPDEIRARLLVARRVCAGNGSLHAGAIVTLAVTCCCYAVVPNLPEGAEGFTTIELKSNFFGTTLEGHVECVATPVHKGRSTQVWDALVRAQGAAKPLALFRCTQMILYPRA